MQLHKSLLMFNSLLSIHLHYTNALQVINGSSAEDQTCSPEETACKFNCIGEKDCGTDGSIGDGPILTCPTTTDCEYCELYCKGERSCRSATFNGENCKLVNVSMDSIDGTDQDQGQYITINAPGNNGDLYVDIINSGDDPLRRAEIYSSNSNGGTNNMIIHCKVSNGNQECSQSVMDATYANYFELNCYEEASCYQTTIHCPQNSSLKHYSNNNHDSDNNNNNNNNKPCQINLYNPEWTYIDVNVIGNGWSDDLDILCTSTSTNGCSAEIICDNGSCDYSSDGTCDGVCQPTTIPTIVPTTEPSNPTLLPSIIPSIEPSDIPSIEPSNIPTSEPTIVPTRVPSFGPVIDPTIYPTNLPSNRPSAIPTEETIEPSDVPSGIPSGVPSLKPSVIPSLLPTTEPAIVYVKSTEKPSHESSDESDDESIEIEIKTTDKTVKEEILNDNKDKNEDSIDTVLITVIGVLVGVLVCLLIIYLALRNKLDQKKRESMSLVDMEEGQVSPPDVIKVKKSKLTMESVQSTSGVEQRDIDTPDPKSPKSPNYPSKTSVSSYRKPFMPWIPSNNDTPGNDIDNNNNHNKSSNIVNNGEGKNNSTNANNVGEGEAPEGDNGNNVGNIRVSNVKVGVVSNEFEDEKDVIHHEEKEIEYVTKGGKDSDMINEKIDNNQPGSSVVAGAVQPGAVDNNNDDEDTDTSQSSEAEMEELRNQIVAQSIAQGVTPGGPVVHDQPIVQPVIQSVGKVAQVSQPMIEFMIESNTRPVRNSVASSVGTRAEGAERISNDINNEQQGNLVNGNINDNINNNNNHNQDIEVSQVTPGAALV